MLSIPACPICGGIQFQPRMSCKDYTVSKEVFNIVECARCHLYITNPRPDEKIIANYYLSDDYISHSSKSTGPIDLIYKVSRQFTLKWKTRLIKKYAPSITSILDYGCGTGNFTESCLKENWKTSGVEPSENARMLAIKRDNRLHIASDLSEFENSTFDAITLWHVLEHIPDLQQKISALIDRLNKNGTIFIAVPNHESYDAIKFQECWAGYDVPRHLWHFSKENIEQLLSKNGMRLITILPMKLDSYYVSILSNKYTTGRHTLLGFTKGILIGFLSNVKARKFNNYSSLIYIARKK